MRHSPCHFADFRFSVSVSLRWSTSVFETCRSFSMFLCSIFLVLLGHLFPLGTPSTPSSRRLFGHRHTTIIWHFADYHSDCCLGAAGDPVSRPQQLSNPLRYRCNQSRTFQCHLARWSLHSDSRTPLDSPTIDPLIERVLSKQTVCFCMSTPV
jgi:hypothetical protein